MFNRVVAVTALLFVLTGAAAAEAATYRVKWGQVRMRTSPSPRGTSLGFLKKGHRLPVQRFVGSYARFTFFGKRIYVYKGALERVGAPPRSSNSGGNPLAALAPYYNGRAGAGTYTVRANVNVRKTVSVRSARVGGLRKGQRVTVLGIHKNWARISFGGHSRFVVASFLQRGTPAPSGGPLAGLVPYVSGTAGAGYYETTAKLNIRETILPSSKVLRVIPRGQRVRVAGIYKNRARINLGFGKRGWAVASFLRKPRPKPAPRHPALTSRAQAGRYRVTLRSGITLRPAPRSNTSLGKLKYNAEVEVAGIAQGWARTGRGRTTRYVSSRYLKRVLPPSARRGTYTAKGSITVRTSPSSRGAVAGRLLKGNRIAVTAVRSDGWAVITFRGKRRFARAANMTKVSSVITSNPSQGATAVDLTRYVKLGNGITLRREPKLSGAKITTLGLNTRVAANLRYGSYYYVVVGNRIGGWVHSVGLGTKPVVLPLATAGSRLSPTLLFKANRTTVLLREPKLSAKRIGSLSANRRVRATRRARPRVGVIRTPMVLVQSGGKPLGWVLEAHLERQVDTSLPVRTESDSDSVSKTVGSRNWVGCTVSRSAQGSQNRNRASYTSTTTLSGHLLGGTTRLINLHRSLGKSIGKRVTDSSRLTFIGTSFDINRRLGKAFPWLGSRAADGSILGRTLFTFTVFGFKINVNGAIFAEVDLGPSVTVRSTSVEAAMTGSFKVAGSGEFELDLFIGGFGPKAELAVVEVSVPATLTVGLQRIGRDMGPAFANFTVSISVGSNIKIGGFARFGVGRFSYTKTKYVFQQTLAETSYTVLRANLAGN
jgi:uncharacterized protein YgiM (DUF1202 family)